MLDQTLHYVTLTQPPAIPTQYREPIIDVLRQMYSRAQWNMQESFGIHGLPPLTGERLLLMPLAETLAEIAQAAAGQRQHDEFGDGVLQECIQSIAELLFATPFAYSYAIPATFWETSLGAMLARARLWLRSDELITITQAAELAGKSQPAITQLLDKGKLTAYYDPDAPERQGRRLVSRTEIAELAAAVHDD